MLLSGHGFMNTVRYISLLSILIFLFAANAVAQQEQATDVVVDEIPLDSAVYETMHGNRDAVNTVKEQIRSVMREKDGVKVCFRIHPAGSNATVIYWNDSSGESVLGTVDADGELCNNLPVGAYRYRIDADEYFPDEGILELNEQDTVCIEEVSLRSRFVNVKFDADDEVSVFLNNEFLGIGSVTRRLKSGVYNVKWSRENYLSKMETVTVYERDTIIFRQPDLVPQTGTLSIKSYPSGADVYIDGMYYGKTSIEAEVSVGNHELLISKNGYLSQNEDLLIVYGEAESRSYYLEPEKKEVAVSAAVSNYTKAYEPIPAPVSAGMNFSSDETKEDKLFTFGVEATLGLGYDSDAEFMSFTASVGPMLRIGRLSNRYNLLLGARVAISANDYSDNTTTSHLELPIFLNRNFLSSDEETLFVGLGCEIPVPFSQVNNYPSSFLVFNAGYASTTWGLRLFLKLDMGTVAEINSGLAFSYSF